MSMVYNNKSLKNLAIIALPIYIVGIFYFTLFWRSQGIAGAYNLDLNIIPFFWLIEPLFMGKDFYIDQVFLNMVMFLPFGMLLPFILKNHSINKVAFTSLGATLFIEFVQPLFGRCTDIDDVMLNVTGAILGYLIISTFEHTISKMFQKHHTIYLPVYGNYLTSS